PRPTRLPATRATVVLDARPAAQLRTSSSPPRLESGRAALPLMTVPARDRDGITPIAAELREILLVDVVEHRDHDPRRLLGWVLVGDVVQLLRLRVLHVAMAARDTEILFIPFH